MSSQKTAASNPVTFELPVALIDKLESARARRGLGSSSEVIRIALEHFNYGSYEVKREDRRQISVRLPDALKKNLQRQARIKRTSAGELLRAAIDHLPATGAKKKR